MKFRKILIAFAIVNIGLTSITNINMTVAAPEDGVLAEPTPEEKEIEKKRPTVKSTTPYNKETYVNPGYLYNSFWISKDGKIERQSGNYISVTFKSNDGLLSTPLTSESSMSSLGFDLKLNGESTNLVDDSRSLYIAPSTDNKEITINIPVKDECNEGATYTAYAPESLVYSKSIQNKAYTWEFTIDSTPTINKVIDGSVPEGFSEKEYITIEGNNFRRGTYVMFRSTMDGKEYDAYTEKYDSDEKQILKVYLPRGRYSLPVGTYDIIVSNGRNLESEYTYGTFSVVPKGNYIPNEEYKKTDRDTDGKYINVGEVKKYTQTSADTLLLDSRYSNSFRVDLDLDKIMGEDVWTRNIGYSANTYGTIDILNIYSKWADINLYGVSLRSYTRDREVSISTGRVSPTVEDMLKKKLANKNIKSDFIQVSGDNYNLSSLKMNLPFKNSNGENLKVLRYDEEMRRFSEINFKTNKTDKTVEFTSVEKGIFVVVD